LGLELDGLRVRSVTEDGMAGRSKLQAGDTIVAVGDQKVGNARELLAEFRKQAEEDGEVVLSVQRGGDHLQIKVRP
ncbi:MAG: PDZ domain-containing protein, partial [Planctomycetes bacterium]|nr:PDZ domain-containing protein [Planctomycetota bacterium]